MCRWGSTYNLKGPVLMSSVQYEENKYNACCHKYGYNPSKHNACDSRAGREEGRGGERRGGEE